MAQVAGPYGLRPVKHAGELVWPGPGIHTFPLTANQTAGFFYGDPVGLVAGVPTPLTASPLAIASPASAPTAANPIGIFVGCSFQDPIRGFVNAQFLPANAIAAGATKVAVKIADYPGLVMQIQATGPVQLIQIGMNAALTGFGAGSTFDGNSNVALLATSIAATGTLAVKIYDFVYNASPSPGASSIPGDPFTDVLVIWNFGVHRYQISTGL
jgi:hypothetical protein